MIIGFSSSAIGMELDKQDKVFYNSPMYLQSVSQRRSIANRDFNEKFVLQQLLDLVKKNNVKDIKEIFNEKPQLARRSCGQMVLYEALKMSQHNCIELLLMYEVSPNAVTVGGNCPLHCARDVKSAQLLIDYGADVEQKNDKGQTAVFSAMHDSRFDVARILFKAGININDGDKNGDTPLHYAVISLGKEEVKFLLYHGANADQPNNKGITAYQMAWDRAGDTFQAFEECKKVLFLPGNIVFYNKCFNDKPSDLINLLAHDGRNLKKLLMLDAAGYCSSDIVIAENVFKKQCTDKIWTELSSKVSPFSSDLLLLVKKIKARSSYRIEFLNALQNNQFFIAKQLIQSNPYLLYTYKNEYPFDEVNNLLANKFFAISVSESDYRHIKDLLYECFDFNFYDDQGRTLLCQLIDSIDTIKYKDLLKTGIPVNTIDNYGKSPLSYAILRGDEDKIKTLLQYDAVVRDDMLIEESAYFLSHLLNEVFCMQKCLVCKKHEYNMSNIPCINRHVGNFICKYCYELMNSECPECGNILNEYGM
jgi:ankyrin repeat protein